MKRIATITICFVALILMSFVITKDDPTYKNLKVLPKNTNKTQMDSIMRQYAAALGVRCNFCHQFNEQQRAMDFASDGNEHKGIARQMMKMTAKLNSKYFDVKDSKKLTAKLEVSCYTCHNGKAEPAKLAPVQRQQPQQQQQQRPPADSARRQ